MQVNRVATMQIETARPDEPVREIADKMLRGNVGFIPVVDVKDRPVGVVTDRDLALRVVAEGLNPANLYARDVMSEPVHWIYEDAEIEEAAQLMMKHLVRRLLVRNHRGSAVGVLSLDDLALFSAGDQTAARVLGRMAEATAVAGAFEEDLPHWPASLK